MTSGKVRIDLGCGNAKREGFIGLDFVDGPEVDHVVDLTAERFPFDDASVDEVFSAHFLEHIESPNHVFGEIGRICKDGARIEFWTPYAFSDEGFLYGHLHYLTEEPWMHFCVSHRDFFAEMLAGRWLLHRINYVVPPATKAELDAYGLPIEFAIKYLKGVVYEFGVEIEYRRDLAHPVVVPVRSWSTTRFGERIPFGEEPSRLSLPAVIGVGSGVPRVSRAVRTSPTLRRLASHLPERAKVPLRRMTRVER